jgi:hypothetical protein
LRSAANFGDLAAQRPLSLTGRAHLLRPTASVCFHEASTTPLRRDTPSASGRGDSHEQWSRPTYTTPSRERESRNIERRAGPRTVDSNGLLATRPRARHRVCPMAEANLGGATVSSYGALACEFRRNRCGLPRRDAIRLNKATLDDRSSEAAAPPASGCFQTASINRPRWRTAAKPLIPVR